MHIDVMRGSFSVFADDEAALLRDVCISCNGYLEYDIGVNNGEDRIRLTHHHMRVLADWAREEVDRLNKGSD